MNVQFHKWFPQEQRILDQVSDSIPVVFVLVNTCPLLKYIKCTKSPKEY